MELYDYQIDLIEQVKDAWRHGIRSPCIVLPCGGGKSVIAAEMAKKTTENGKYVLFLVHRKELMRQIEQTFVSHGVDMTRCTVGMVQSLSKHIERITPPALIITDETHHAVAAGYQKIYEAFPNARRVGITATPKRADGKGLSAVYEKLLIGPSVKELIANKKLSPFRVFAPQQLDLKNIPKRHGEYDMRKAEELLKERKVYGSAVEQYRKIADGQKAIAFCPTVQSAEKTAESFMQAGIAAASVGGSTPPNERERIMDGFRAGSITVLCSCDLISEGFDVPDCSVSILLRPTVSLTLYTQQAMRCMRYKEGKTAIILDHVGNVLRHGLPDLEQDWTLSGKEAKEKQKTYALRLCPECFCQWHDGYICPACGHEIKPEVQKKTKEQHIEESARLVEITESAKADYHNYSRMRSLWELQQFAKARGYKSGWAYHKAKELGLVKIKR